MSGNCWRIVAAAAEKSTAPGAYPEGHGVGGYAVSSRINLYDVADPPRNDVAGSAASRGQAASTHECLCATRTATAVDSLWRPHTHYSEVAPWHFAIYSMTCFVSSGFPPMFPSSLWGLMYRIGG